ncbi:ureidoglycolate lyase [uncultured Devosia sp.]|uniref:ureidoglycolate lyase n=1 Tax=uncultured Devosia sp. TaxID=211434 RepID=UPI0035CACCF5
MTRGLVVGTAPSADAFAPFGTFIDKPAEPGQRRFYSQWLGGEALEAVFHVNNVSPVSLPVMLTKLERHPHAAQCFVPLDVERYLVAVAPSAPDGSPDPQGLISFLLPGSVGIVYARGVWHAGASVLDRVGAFAVLMWRGANDDDVMVDIEPVQLLAGAGEP